MDIREADPHLATLLPLPFARRYRLLPFRRRGEAVEVLTADPYALEALDDCRRLLGQPVVPVPVEEGVLLPLIERLYEKASERAAEVVEDLEAVSLEDLPTEPQDLLDGTSEAPVIRLVNALLAEAVARGASDIHIEPYERRLLVRFRVDGVLHTVLEPPRAAAPSLIARIKVMASLDIAERRRPQDGRLKVRVGGREVDIRLSVLPTAYGERLVMRLLRREGLLGLEALGLEACDRSRLERLIRLPHGMLLVTGPTGSGKTTTLYAALSAIASDACNILTIEDPIEYELPGVGQMQVNPKTGLTFAAGLRAILRQDPDVIMVGEIRDLEAARIAVQAALTGHLVFSTLHTNDAPSACTRLADIGVEPFLLASALKGVVAQRLVRVLCPRCRIPYTPSPEERAALGIEAQVLYRPQGCEGCLGTGYRGRTGLYEVLEVDEEAARLIRTRAPEAALRQRVGTGLREAGLRKAALGITSVEEVLRVTD